MMAYPDQRLTNRPTTPEGQLEDLRERLRYLAACLSVGWEEYTDPIRGAYGDAFKEAARRINEEVDL